MLLINRKKTSRNKIVKNKVKSKKNNMKIDKIIDDIENYLDNNYFKKQVSIRRMVEIYNEIDKKGTDKKNNRRLYDIQEYLYGKDKKKYNKLNKFFNAYNKQVRIEATKSPLWQKNIKSIIDYIRKENIKINEKTAKPIFEEAYNYTLDQYDKDESKNNPNLMTWIGYWSLIDINKSGKITGVWVSDSADRDYFWGYIQNKYPKNYKIWTADN